MGYGGGGGGYSISPPQPFISGATASIADGATVTHGWGKTPVWVVAVGTVALNSIAITAIGATTFTVSIKVDSTGAAGTNQVVYWMAGG